MNDLLHRVETFLQSDPYYPCLLLVHPRIQRLHEAADILLARYDWPQASIGQELSADLLPVTPGRRPDHAGRWLASRMLKARPGPLLCRDIDLLFEPSLNLEPLTLLRAASRSTRLVVLWPGDYTGAVLSYAVPAHAHYRPVPDPQVSIERLP